MKRLLAALTMVGMSVALFAGCGSMANAQKSENTQSKVESVADSSVSEAIDDTEEEYVQSVEDKKKDVWEAPTTGVTFDVPENIKDVKGQFSLTDGGETSDGSDCFTAGFIYLPKTDDEARATSKLSKTTEDEDELEPVLSDFFYGMKEMARILATKEGKEIPESVKEIYMPEGSTITEIGTAGGYKYYFIIANADTILSDVPEDMSDEMYADLKGLYEQLPEFPNYITVTGVQK